MGCLNRRWMESGSVEWIVHVEFGDNKMVVWTLLLCTSTKCHITDDS